MRAAVDNSRDRLAGKHIGAKEGSMASTTAPATRESHKKLKPKPKTEHKSWQTRNAARKEKQTAHAAKRAAEVGH